MCSGPEDHGAYFGIVPIRTAAEAYRTGGSPERRDPPSLLRDHARIVERQSAGRFTLDEHSRVRPHWHAHATAAALTEAHDVSPLSAVNVAEFVARAYKMTDLMRQSVVRGSALMMHH